MNKEKIQTSYFFMFSTGKLKKSNFTPNKDYFYHFSTFDQKLLQKNHKDIDLLFYDSKCENKAVIGGSM